jgi:hypothetical protein
MRSSFLSESIESVVNRTVIESEVSEAAALFPSVREQLSVDACTQKFFVNDSVIETADIRSLPFLHSGEKISIGRSQGWLFLSCSKCDIGMNLSDLMMERWIDLEAVDVSVLSVEALDSLLLSKSVSVGSEDALLQSILKLGSGSRDLLKHIQMVFLNGDDLSLLDEYFKIPPESVWQ